MTYRHDLHGMATHCLRSQDSEGRPSPRGGRARRGQSLAAPIPKFLQKNKEGVLPPNSRIASLRKLRPALSRDKSEPCSDEKAFIHHIKSHQISNFEFQTDSEQHVFLFTMTEINR